MMNEDKPVAQYRTQATVGPPGVPPSFSLTRSFVLLRWKFSNSSIVLPNIRICDIRPTVGVQLTLGTLSSVPSMAASLLLTSIVLLLFLHESRTSPTHGTVRVPSITSYAALGDSYPAGAGAGSPRYSSQSAFICGRFSDAYPIQIANDARLSIKRSNFKHLACGGATSLTVLHNQVPHIGQSDLVSITIGGNEVDFVKVLNECIYHWHPFSTCDAALVESRRLLEAPALRRNFDTLITGVVDRLKPGAVLLVTGYPRFFNDQTDLCDHITFSRTRPLDYLTKSKRKALNRLVDILNDMIRAIAEVHGATYVNIDAAFAGHRFCEEGVHEPDLQREDTWLFNLPAPDMATDTKKHVAAHPEMVFQRNHGAMEVVEFPSLNTLKILHPTSQGHQGISREVIRVLEAMDRVIQ